MFLKLLLAFTIIPLVELAMLIQLSKATSLLVTVGIVIFTGIVGSMLARWQGALAWQRFRQALAEGRMPAPEVQDGLLIFFAAGMLLTPGLLTDAMGFLLLIPQTRLLARHFLAARIGSRFQIQTFGFGENAQPTQSDPNTIDAAAASVRSDERTDS
ncbi:FxsA family protein [Rosistilla oblonga]|uniref:FxsA family protein n=1 Tax=Rosistilla oblonga TaxID=2527990 RepID=UPI003A984A5D